MKRYLIFSGHLWYPAGGAKDYVMSFSKKPEAHSYAHTLAQQHRNNWAQVWDTKLDKVEEFYCEIDDY